jgi:hypothetical protein
MPDKPLILALVHSPAVREAIAQYGGAFDLQWSFEAFGYEKTDEPARREVAGVAELHPALVVIELDQPADWLSGVRSDSATRRIPVIAIADDEVARQRADAAHADRVLSSPAFLAALPGVLTDNAKIFRLAAALGNQCDGVPSSLVIKGLEEFNAHQYFECHETLEAAWKEEPGPVRELYRAILQVGIAYYQIERGNYWGAHKMFLRMLQWFAPLPDRCQGIDVARLREDAAAARAHLEALGPERVGDFERTLLKPVFYEGVSA